MPALRPAARQYLLANLAYATIEQSHDVNDPWWIGDTTFLISAFERFLARQHDGIPSSSATAP